MTISRSLIALAAATAVAFGGATVAQTASAQTTSREWGFADISDSDTTRVETYGTFPGSALTFKNPTQLELRCHVQTGPDEYIKPQFSPWVQSGIPYSKAYALYSAAHTNYERAQSQSGAHLANAYETYIAPGSTREIKLAGKFIAGESVMISCDQQTGSNLVLFGYGTVQDDLSIKSSIPVDDNDFPLPPTTPPVVTTVTETETATQFVTEEPITETVTLEPSTVIATTTAVKSVPTTVRQTVVSQLPTETVTQTQTATVTSTLAAPTVTKTVSAEPSDSGSSDGSVIGWIIGIFVALGLGGIAGFMAQSSNIPGLTF